MTLMAREMRASYAFVERNFNLSKRYWGWEIAWLIYSVAGALAVSLIGRDQHNERLLVVLVIGTIFWNYLSLVFEFIAETVQWERWEGTLEYTMMAPVRRYSQLLGSAFYAIAYGLVHTTFILTILWLFFQLNLSHANFGTAIVFMLLGSFSFVGLGLCLYFASQGAGKVLGPVLAATVRLLLVALGGWALTAGGAPLWTLFALVGLSLAAYGLTTAAAVYVTSWGPRGERSTSAL